jgi:hypothetical protein
MSATLTVDRKKYVRLANRIVVKAIETEEVYDRMVAAVKGLMDKGENNLSPEESALLERVWLSFWTNLRKSDRTSCRRLSKTREGRCPKW